MKPHISIRNLTIKYDEAKVIEDFSCNFSIGTYAIMGKSGIGKTSLIRAMLGLIPYEGTIDYDPEPLFSVVFQEDRLCEGISVRKNIAMVSDIPDEAITEALNELGLENCLNTRVSELSGGMKRRVAILRGLLANSNILILDEPFKGLDADNKITVMECVKKKTSDKTVLLITHDLSEAKFFNSEIINLIR